MWSSAENPGLSLLSESQLKVTLLLSKFTLNWHWKNQHSSQAVLPLQIPDNIFETQCSPPTLTWPPVSPGTFRNHVRWLTPSCPCRTSPGLWLLMGSSLLGLSQHSSPRTVGNYSEWLQRIGSCQKRRFTLSEPVLLGFVPAISTAHLFPLHICPSWLPSWPTNHTWIAVASR